MDCSTVKRAAILIYIRGQRPAVNHHTECICYLHDKPGAGKRCGQWKLDKPIPISILKAALQRPRTTQDNEERQAGRSDRAGGLMSGVISNTAWSAVRTEGYANTPLYKSARPLWITLHAQKAVNRSSRLWFMDSDVLRCYAKRSVFKCALRHTWRWRQSHVQRQRC